VTRAVQTWALIVDCFREAIDRKIFWVMIVISVVIAAAMACIGFDEDGMSVLFGVWTVDASDYSPESPLARGLIGSILTKYIADLYIAWIGIIIALVGTAGIFPSLIERGAIDIVLSKPMSRVKIFLAKYAGSMVFVALQASVFVVLTFLVVGLRWNQWFWAYLWCIPLIVVLFSYIYAFVALFGVVTRSAMTALLLGMVAWIVIWIPQTTYEVMVTFSTQPTEESSQDAEGDGSSGDGNWLKRVRFVRSLFPKTTDIAYIAGDLIGASTAIEVLTGGDLAALSEQERAQIESQIAAERRLTEVHIVKSIGSSLLFEAVIVFIALWRFSRQDF
jgi:ABC-type transport system involved in multi-copper enzyme maturation permease subunit